MKKTPLKRSMTPLKRTPIKRKPVDPEKKKAREEQHNLDKAFYMSIWESRPHYCVSCNKYLGSEPSTYNFDHILEKAKYPELRYEKNNIGLLCLQCHGSKTNGFPSKKYQEIIEGTKKMFLNM